MADADLSGSTSSAGATTDRGALLRLAKASPEVAARHDKAAWLALYTHDAVVQDPVGTPESHAGRRQGRFGDELGRFYEAFIALSDLEMEARKEIVSDHYVFRAVDIHTTNLKTGLQMTVPANLLYSMVSEDGRLLIESMHAHWELNRMSRAIMSKGIRGLRTVGVMNRSMLRAFGPRWLMAYFRASQDTAGRAGKALIEQLAGRDHADVDTVFTADASVELPGAVGLQAGDFLEECSALGVADLLVSGWTVSGLAVIAWQSVLRDAAFIADVDRASKRVQRLRWFWES